MVHGRARGRALGAGGGGLEVLRGRPELVHGGGEELHAVADGEAVPRREGSVVEVGGAVGGGGGDDVLGAVDRRANDVREGLLVEVRDDGEGGQAELRVERAVAVRGSCGFRRGVEGDRGSRVGGGGGGGASASAS
uniref:Uncharacterized protein n=1 Tax=Arundo donax TaxID=35708 RepID=A0A0A8XXY6_ARUDO